MGRLSCAPPGLGGEGNYLEELMSKSPRSRAVGKAKHSKMKRRGDLAEFLAASPLRGSRLRVRRSKDRVRKIVL